MGRSAAQKGGKARGEGESTATRKRASAGAKKGAPKTRAKAGQPALATLVSGPSIATARVESVEGDRVRISLAGLAVVALRDECVHPAVLQGAARRGERVLVERNLEGVWVVLGALRTQPTPGIDVAEEYTIEAERVKVKAHGEVVIAAETTSVVLRGDEGEIESRAPRIVSHADGLHQITGRTLRLN